MNKYDLVCFTKGDLLFLGYISNSYAGILNFYTTYSVEPILSVNTKVDNSTTLGKHNSQAILDRELKSLDYFIYNYIKTLGSKTKALENLNRLVELVEQKEVVEQIKELSNANRN